MGWPGRFIHVRRCGGLSMVRLQLKDPLEVFVKATEFLFYCGFPFRLDVTEAAESCWVVFKMMGTNAS